MDTTCEASTLHDVTPFDGLMRRLQSASVGALDAEGAVRSVKLVPDNRDYETRTVTPADGDVRVVAELVEVLG